MNNITYGEYLVHVGETEEQLRETSGDLELAGLYLKTAEIMWQLARDPDCPERSRINRLREMSEQGVPIDLLREMWTYTGAREDLFNQAMCQAFIEGLSHTPIEEKR